MKLSGTIKLPGCRHRKAELLCICGSELPGRFSGRKLGKEIGDVCKGIIELISSKPDKQGSDRVKGVYTGENILRLMD